MRPDRSDRFFLALLLVSLFLSDTAKWIVFGVALAVTVYSYFRIFSKNCYKRSAENAKFITARYRALAPVRRMKQRAALRKGHRFFRCPACKSEVRVPRGKGKIRITCPKCGERFVRKS